MLECSLNVSLCELDIYITSDDALHCPSTNLSGSQILASFDPLNSLPTCRKWGQGGVAQTPGCTEMDILRGGASRCIECDPFV